MGDKLLNRTMANYPDSKISLTILDFGKNFLSLLPEPHQKNELEACIEMIILVWNSVTLDSIAGSTNHIDAVFAVLKDEPPEYLLHVKRLIARKRRHFSTDLRGVGNRWIKEENGEFVFGCDARAIAG